VCDLALLKPWLWMLPVLQCGSARGSGTSLVIFGRGWGRSQKGAAWGGVT